MQFAQYQRQEETPIEYGYHDYPIPFQSTIPLQQHYANGGNDPVSLEMEHRLEDYNNSQEERGTTRKEPEEMDTSSRPRLTTDQTNVLEEHFRREAKPITDVKRKLADQIGLSLEKVNVCSQLDSFSTSNSLLTTNLLARTGTRIAGLRRSTSRSKRY